MGPMYNECIHAHMHACEGAIALRSRVCVRIESEIQSDDEMKTWIRMSYRACGTIDDHIHVLFSLHSDIVGSMNRAQKYTQTYLEDRYANVPRR